MIGRLAIGGKYWVLDRDIFSRSGKLIKGSQPKEVELLDAEVMSFQDLLTGRDEEMLKFSFKYCENGDIDSHVVVDINSSCMPESGPTIICLSYSDYYISQEAAYLEWNRQIRLKKDELELELKRRLEALDGEFL